MGLLYVSKIRISIVCGAVVMGYRYFPAKSRRPIDVAFKNFPVKVPDADAGAVKAIVLVASFQE